MYQIIETEDKSHTILDTRTGEHYHSIHGAIQESKHIFIEAGLNSLNPTSQTINILEVGMGTGLNILLTYLHTENYIKKINYIAVELYPIDNLTAMQLNYCQQLKRTDCESIFKNIHNGNWNFPYYLSDNFILKKLGADFKKIEFSDLSFNLVYFDAFSPENESDLWTDEVFEKLYKAMKNNSILVTYCAKGIVKRSLKKAGFNVELLSGPIGKRHIIRAIKSIEISDCCKHKK